MGFFGVGYGLGKILANKLSERYNPAHDKGRVEYGTFDGYPAKIIHNAGGDNPNRLDILFGGHGAPDGPGHGHAVSNDGENFAYLRFLEDDRKNPTVNDRTGKMG